MSYTNREILAAVVNKWAQPAIHQLVSTRIDTIPFLLNIEERVKSTHFVSNKWHLSNELAPILSNVSGAIIEPLICNAISKVPDDVIPRIAYEIVNSAIENGGLSLFEGKVEFSIGDMQELKRYIEVNLPLCEIKPYEVKEE